MLFLQTTIVYTPWSNLRKDPTTMKDGAVGFHSSAFRRLRHVEKNRAIVKSLEKTRTEAHPDLRREKISFEKRCIEYNKKRTKAIHQERLQNDPHRRAQAEALAKKQAHEEFLASGGYHAG